MQYHGRYSIMRQTLYAINHAEFIVGAKEHIMSSSEFFDLPVEDRAAAYEAAEERGGVGRGNFFDLSAEERGAAYDRALGCAEEHY